MAFSAARRDRLGFPQPSLRRPLRIALIGALIGACLGAWLIPAPAHRLIHTGQQSPPASLHIIDESGLLSTKDRRVIEAQRFYAPAEIVVVVGGAELLHEGRSPSVDERQIREHILVEHAPEVLRDPQAPAPMLNSEAVVLVLVPDAGFAGAVVPHRYEDVLGPFERLDLLLGLRHDVAARVADDPDAGVEAAMTSLAHYVHAPASAAYQWGWIGAALGALLGFAAGRIRPTTGTRRQLLRRVHALPRPSLYGILDDPYHRTAQRRLEAFQQAHAGLLAEAGSLSRAELDEAVRRLERQYLLLAILPALARSGSPLLDIDCAAALGANADVLTRARACLAGNDLSGEELVDEEARRLALAGSGDLAALRLLDVDVAEARSQKEDL